jgi:hypothetical protein
MVKNWNNIFDIRSSKFRSDFRLFNTESDTLGDTYVDTQKSYTNLVKHGTINQIIETLIHEDLHVPIIREDLNEDMEHILIKMLFWAMDGLIIDN